jgi:hypothetical protein
MAADIGAITEIYDLAVVGKIDKRLGAEVEATFPVALGKGTPGGVAALNGQGKPIDTNGNPMAVIGTTAGTAADAKATSDALAAVAQNVATVSGTVAGKANSSDVVRSTFMAATPTNSNLIAAGETASPTDPLIIYTLGR